MQAEALDVPRGESRDLQRSAHAHGRATAEPVRNAMAPHHKQHARPRLSLRELAPLSVGEVLEPLGPDDDLLGEMLDGRRAGNPTS